MGPLDGWYAPTEGHDERLLPLCGLAESRNAWRNGKRLVVCELAGWVEEGESLSELRAAQDDTDVMVALVTDRRLLIGRRNDRTGAVHVEPITLDDVVAAGADAEVAGDIRITWTDGHRSRTPGQSPGVRRLVVGGGLDVASPGDPWDRRSCAGLVARNRRSP